MTIPSFPALTPSSRSFQPGDFANTKYLAASGAEFRILYGSKRTRMKLQMGFENLTDAQAELILTHYNNTKGTFEVFELNQTVKAGWEGTGSAIGAVDNGSKWRYADEPRLVSIYPGVSTVTVNLIAATI